MPASTPRSRSLVVEGVRTPRVSRPVARPPTRRFAGGFGKISIATEAMHHTVDGRVLMATSTT